MQLLEEQTGSHKDYLTTGFLIYYPTYAYGWICIEEAEPILKAKGYTSIVSKIDKGVKLEYVFARKEKEKCKRNR